jgi:hypothetical protein
MIDLTFANTIPGMMTPDEMIVLSNLASLVPKNGKILEIGSYLGRSTAALHAGKDPSVTLTLIDNWDFGIGVVDDDIVIDGDISLYNRAVNLSIEKGTWRAGFELCLHKILHQIEVLQMDSKHFFDHAQYDLIFIDGDHNRPEHDIYNSIANSRTLVFGDDFIFDLFPNVLQVVMSSRGNRVLIFPTEPKLKTQAMTKIWGLMPTEGYWRDNLSKVFDAIQPNVIQQTS